MANKEFQHLKKVENVKFKSYERKTKSPFMIYADFESILCSDVMKKHFNKTCDV